jgi:signal transduction histidine kinase
MMQSEKLDAQQMAEIQVVYESATRLAKLNQALLLLAKIENNQFTESSYIQLDELIKTKLTIFDELIKHKQITVETKLVPFIVKMHPMLADVLVSNLIGNAIKHNVQGGQLLVEVSGTKLIIRNSGQPPGIPPSQLFQRFRKANPASDSLGLGLAIVKEICAVYKFALEYRYEEKEHIISIQM